jgi:hypothetical protein
LLSAYSLDRAKYYWLECGQTPAVDDFAKFLLATNPLQSPLLPGQYRGQMDKSILKIVIAEA